VQEKSGSTAVESSFSCERYVQTHSCNLTYETSFELKGYTAKDVQIASEEAWDM